MPRSKLNVRVKPVSDNVVAAANDVLQNQLSLRQASIDFKVSKATLCRPKETENLGMKLSCIVHYKMSS